jgi:FkbM family methyltransferase
MHLRTIVKNISLICLALVLIFMSIFGLNCKSSNCSHNLKKTDHELHLTRAGNDLALARKQVESLQKKVESLQESRLLKWVHSLQESLMNVKKDCACQVSTGLAQRDRMVYLKEQGLNPENVLDVGANAGGWTKEMKLIFPKAQFFMIEANARHTQALLQVGSPFRIGTVGNVDKQVVTFFSSAKFERANTGASLFREIGINGKGNPDFEGGSLMEENLTMRTIDSLVAETGIEGSFHLVKFDVQGAEILALKGATSVLRNAGFVLLEMSVSFSTYPDFDRLWNFVYYSFPDTSQIRIR